MKRQPVCLCSGWVLGARLGSGLAGRHGTAGRPAARRNQCLAQAVRATLQQGTALKATTASVAPATATVPLNGAAAAAAPPSPPAAAQQQLPPGVIPGRPVLHMEDVDGSQPSNRYSFSAQRAGAAAKQQSRLRVFSGTANPVSPQAWKAARHSTARWLLRNAVKGTGRGGGLAPRADEGSAT